MLPFTRKSACGNIKAKLCYSALHINDDDDNSSQTSPLPLVKDEERHNTNATLQNETVLEAPTLALGSSSSSTLS